MTHHLEHQGHHFTVPSFIRGWPAPLHLQVPSFAGYLRIGAVRNTGHRRVFSCENFPARDDKNGEQIRLGTFEQTNSSPKQRRDGVDCCRDVLRRHSPRHPIYAPKRANADRVELYIGHGFPSK